MKFDFFRFQIVLLFLLLFTGALVRVLGSAYAVWFAHSGFHSLQSLRCSIFSICSFSFGDLWYILVLIVVVGSVIRWFKIKAWRARAYRMKSLLVVSNVILGLAILFFVLWSSLYQQPKLAHQLSLNGTNNFGRAELFQFNQILVDRLNSEVSAIDSVSVAVINNDIANLYMDAGIGYPLIVKNSLFSKQLSYLGIEGYFNPFSGEAQINSGIPHFMKPFTIAHELAHQTGIAAEDDANLMAYVHCVTSRNSTYRYSAYFNIWLYAQNRCFRLDSNMANAIKAQLNPISKAHLDVLKRRQIQYQNVLNSWSSQLFDLFLKAGNQSDGIASYGVVVQWAWLWEQKYANNPPQSQAQVP